MVAISLRRLVAVSVWLPAVAAGLGAEQPIPGGPVQTAAPNLKEAASHATPRAVTAHPHARGLLQKRDTRTCGYVDGNSMLAYVCSYSAAQCLYNTVASAVGCCLTTSCNIYTACLPYSSSAATATLDMDRTRYCSDSASPYCAVLSYADPTNSLSGYTIPTCDSVPTTYKFYFSSSSASSPTTRSSSTSSRSLTRASSSSDASSTGDADETQSTPATSSTAAPGPVTSSGSSTPVGPIVGGVVGGVAALGLIGLGIFFLVRRKNQTPTTPPPPPAVAAAAAPPPGPAPAPFNSPPPGPYSNQKPPLDMGLAPGAAPVFDPRYSVAPSMSSPTTVSPAGSPMPGYPALGIATPPPQGYSPPPPQGYAPQGYAPQGYAPPPQYAPQNTQFAPYPGQQMQPPPQQQQQYHSVAELPAQRGDGQVHELS